MLNVQFENKFDTTKSLKIVFSAVPSEVSYLKMSEISMIFSLLSFTFKLAALFEKASICNCQGFSPPAFVTIGKSDLFHVCFNVSNYFNGSSLLILTGAVFSDRLQADYETAFRLAIDKINNDRSILPNTELKVVVNKSATLDAFKNIQMGKSLRLSFCGFSNIFK